MERNVLFEFYYNVLIQWRKLLSTIRIDCNAIPFYYFIVAAFSFGVKLFIKISRNDVISISKREILTTGTFNAFISAYSLTNIVFVSDEYDAIILLTCGYGFFKCSILATVVNKNNLDILQGLISQISKKLCKIFPTFIYRNYD